MATAAIAGALAAAALIVGALALTGRVEYPVAIEAGPLSFRHELETTLTGTMEVCGRASTVTPDHSECLSMFIRQPEGLPDTGAWREDADVRPHQVHLVGRVSLRTSEGWSSMLAVLVVKKATGMALLSYGGLVL